MDSLYVCLFSNGHIKVGRSVDPQARVATHADRVSCLGVELVEHAAYECNGPPGPREADLIERCMGQCEVRNANEWFTGLDYPTVCGWAADASQGRRQEFKTRWMRLIAELRGAGLQQKFIADECGTSTSQLSRLALGQQEDVLFSIGQRLIDMHAALAQTR